MARIFPDDVPVADDAPRAIFGGSRDGGGTVGAAVAVGVVARE